MTAFPRMRARNAALVTLLSNPWNASHPPHPVNGSILLPLVPTKDVMFPGAGSLDRGLPVQDTVVVANISHTLPGEAAAVCTS